MFLIYIWIETKSPPIPLKQAMDEMIRYYILSKIITS